MAYHCRATYYSRLTARAEYRQAVLDGYTGSWDDWLELKAEEIAYDTEVYLTEKRDIEMLTTLGTSYHNEGAEWHFPEVEDIE